MFIDYSKKDSGHADFLKVLVYGDAGMGKTFALRTLPPSMLPAVMVDLDRGSRALVGAFPDGAFQVALINTHETSRNGRTKAIGYDEAKKAVTAAANMEPRPRTLILDSMTRLYGCILDYVMERANRGENDPPQLQDYGVASRLTIKFMEACIALNMNLIFIAHERAYASEVTGIEKGVPALTGQLGDIIPRYFDEIWHATVKGRGDQREYLWETAPTGKYIARSRLGLDSVVPQNFESVLKGIV